MSLIDMNTQGTVVISGNAYVGKTLTAIVRDPDGVSSEDISYQWYAGRTPIRNANKSTYTPDSGVTNSSISVKVSYKDNANFTEKHISKGTEKVTYATDNNEGSVIIKGNAYVGKTLTAIVRDPDGVSSEDISYQWYAGRTPIRNANRSTYTPDSGVTNSSISVKVSYKDNANFTERHISKGTAKVTYATDNNEGSVIIKGNAYVGKTLTAIVRDPDGVSSEGISYQWYAGKTPIRNANKSTYTPDSGVTNSSISVKVSYKDNANFIERHISKGTAKVTHLQSNTVDDVLIEINRPLKKTTSSTLVLDLKEKNSLVVDVTDAKFGAKGNGHADDTLAIQKAIDYVSKAGGGTVKIPEGIYLANTEISISMRDNVTVKMDDNTIIEAIPNSLDVYDIFRFINVENAKIIGGTLVGDRYEHKGTTGEWGSGIRIFSSRNIVIEDVTAKDFWGDGFYIGSIGQYDRTDGVVLLNVIADNNRRQGVTISDGDNIRVLDSTFMNSNGTRPSSGLCVEPENNGIVRYLEVYNSKFINNEGTGIALYNKTNYDVEMSSFIIKDNESIGNRSGIIVNGVTDSVVSDNLIDVAGRYEYKWPGMKLDKYSVNNIIKNNTVLDSDIYILNPNPELNTVVGNIIIGDGDNDRVISTLGSDTLIGGAGRVKYTGNEGADIFVISNPINGNNIALIRDFDSSENDKIGLSQSIFGDLKGNWFAAEGKVVTKETRVFQKGKSLYYDKDGSGSEYSETVFAIVNFTLKETTKLTQDDFSINFVL